MIGALEIIVGVLYFTNKIFLAINKSGAWYVGICASLCAVVYFYMLGSLVLVGLEVAFVFIQVLGLAFEKEQTINPKYLYGSILGLIGLLFYLVHNSTWLEFVCSSVFIIGVYLMVIKIRKIAWLLFMFGHSLMAYFTYTKGQYVFMTLQILSVGVAIYALLRIYNAEKVKPLSVK